MSSKSDIDLSDILIDLERRECPQPSCHGELEDVAEIDGDICQSCRCRPNGEYLPPERRDDPPESEGFYRKYANRNPPYEACAKDDGRERYDNSERVILSGGFEHAYWRRINGPEYAIDHDDGPLISDTRDRHR